MALRTKQEHSYRGLLIDLAHTKCQEMAKKAKEVMPEGKMPAEPAASKIVLAKIIDIMNYQYAIKWLIALNEQICPDVVSMQDQLAKLLIDDGESPDEVMKKLVDEVAKMQLELGNY